MIQTMRKIFISAVLALICGCSRSSMRSAYSSLSDQGMLALSTTNPYLASNLFIAQESERSSYLYNFLRSRGAPTAIEILDANYPRPRVLFFYPAEREVYISEQGKVESKPQWITRGPYPIDWKDYRTLAGLSGSMVGDAVLIINGREERFRFKSPERRQPQAALPLLAPTPAAVAPPKRKPKPAPEKIITAGPEKPTEPPPSISGWKPLNQDQLAIYMSKGFAERADNGDILHMVIGTKETVSAVTKWYTGSITAIKDVAAANAIADSDIPNPLVPGKKIRVPEALIKELKVMPPVN